LPPRPSRGLPRRLARLLDEFGRNSLLFDPGRRRHLAVLAALFATSAFLYVLLEPRSVRVLADGRELTIETQQSNDVALLRRTGIDLAEGDRITELDGDGVSVLRIDRARDVDLHVDDEIYRLRTHAHTIDQLLEEAGVALSQRDSVLRDGGLVAPNAPLEPERLLAFAGVDVEPLTGGVIELEVRRAVTFTIVDGQRQIMSTTSLPTVAQALREAGIVVGPGDRVTPELEAPLSSDTNIEVRHANPVTVALLGGHRVVYTFAPTVAELLRDEGIVLPPGAFVDPPFDTRVTSGLRVRVVQLGSSNDVEYEYIEHTTAYRSDASLPPGEIRTVEGHDGVRVRRYEIAFVDGEEVGRTLISETMDPEPVDTVVYYPTRTGQNDTAPEAGSGEVGQVLRVYASAYNAASAGRSPDDPAYGITASGKRVTWGIVAVDPTVIPLGTRMFVPGYGYAVAADTGGAVKGYIIDLGYPDGVAIDWVPKWLDIYILE
jgi:uncharacterized protein YabE (DUF348 family)